MSTSEDDSLMYTEVYEYDYNYTCDQDPSPGFDRAMVLLVLYYVVFCIGLLGTFKKAGFLKRQKINKYVSLHSNNPKITNNSN